jgi:hypothetical protein
MDHSEVSHLFVLHALISSDCVYSGAWLVASAFMAFAFGSEIIQGLSLAAETPYERIHHRQE